jgi:hypothetical protein
VTSRVPTLSFDALDLTSPGAGPAFERYLALPQTDSTRRVALLAQQIVRREGAEGRSGFRQAVALQDYLRTFTYDENVALRHDIGSIEAFLTVVRRGYCEQFAASMAVLARTLGLPSRVAIGFAVGQPGNQPGEYQVTSKQAHAWVEIYFAGYGWTPFEPTPRVDSVIVPPYTTPSSSSRPPVAQATDQPSASPASTATSGVRDPERTRPTKPGQGGSAGRPLLVAGIVLAGLILVFLLALPAAPRIRRLIRMRSASGSGDRVTLAYVDFLDWCAAAGFGRRVGETPREHALRLAELSSDARDPAAGLAEAATAAAYAPPDGFRPTQASSLAHAVRGALVRSLSRRERLKVRIGWGWWRVDPHRGTSERNPVTIGGRRR